MKRIYHVYSPGEDEAGLMPFSSEVTLDVSDVEQADDEVLEALDDAMKRVLSEVFDGAKVITNEELERSISQEELRAEGE